MTSDAPAFSTLLEPHRDLLRAYVYRLVGHYGDAEDLIQETLAKAYERYPGLNHRGAFKSWLLRIATNTCLDYLRHKKRWRPLSQVHLQDVCAEDEEERQDIVETTRNPQFSYDVYEHISFCFTCVGRSLEPTEQAALVLREIFGLSNREAAQILDVTESVLRHQLSSARRAMESTYEGLCALVNKQGVCYQCSGFRKATAEERRGPSLPVLPSGPAGFEERLALVRDKPFAEGVSTSLHELLFDKIQRLESNN